MVDDLTASDEVGSDGARSAFLDLPPAGYGQRIGLFGGSFDPPHEGHRHVCRTALKRLELDAVWWMVTPGNPFKAWHRRPSAAERLAALARFVRHPRFRVTGFEAEHGFGYTARTLAYLKARRPDLRFVWLMGADNLATLHNWYRWRRVVGTVPIAVIDRPGSGYSMISSRFAISYADARIDASDAALLADMDPPAWVFLYGPEMNISSTDLRLRACP